MAVTRGPPGPGRADSRGPQVPSQTPRGPRGGLTKSPRLEGNVSGFGGKSGPVVWSRCCGQPPSWLSPMGLEGVAAASGLGAFLQPSVPAGPGPEAVPRAERLHGQPGRPQRLPRQLLPAPEEAGAGGADDGEHRRGLGRGLSSPAGEGRQLPARQASAVAKGHPAAAPPGVHQGRALGLPEDAHAEEGHARLHLPGVSFPPGAGGPGRGAPLRECWALNSRLSSLEPALEGQAQADLIHSCLHSIMAVLPEPEGVDGHQEV